MKHTNRLQPHTLLWLAISVCWMILIFHLSSQPAEQSSELSTGMLSRILELLFGGATEDLLLRYHTPLRKLAHFGLYFMLGLSLTNTLREQKLVPNVPAAIVLSALYAASDEFHQSFVAGRGPQVSDVLLDTTGAATGALLMSALYLMMRKRRI